MLSRLFISNYAIIEKLEIDFSKRLNIITGETGAGKSILMGALGLILGERADSTALQQEDKKCVVEGFFEVRDNAALKDFFSTNELDGGNEVVLRREISASGKSRSFINDTPVNLTQLKALAVLLVDLHQQFDTLSLSSETFQRMVLDALAGNSKLVDELAERFGHYSNIKKELDSLKTLQLTANKELDYNSFLLEELDQLSLKENEIEALESELRLLNNAENIKQQLGNIYFELKDGEQPLVPQLKVLQNKLSALQDFHPNLTSLWERLSAAVIELADIAGELQRIDDDVNFDEERIRAVNERLSSAYKLLKKHGVQQTAALIEIQQQLRDKTESVMNLSSAIDKLEKEMMESGKLCMTIAEKISKNRNGQVKSFTDRVNALLKQVGMPNARLKVQLDRSPLSRYGIDSVEFLFNANVVGASEANFEPLHKVASGGELSRLMLSIKSLVASRLQLPTLIFDEIDTGISGEASRQVGIIMKDLSANHQLISITHQPQIAAKGDAHYYVYKEVKEGRIVTGIKLLNEMERIEAIAKMLGGEKPTAAAMENAREMVSG